MLEQQADSTVRDGSSTPRITINDDVPEGFEALLGPQFLFVDLFFNETRIGSSGIINTDGIITFDDPEEVAGQLGSLVIDPALEQWLAEPLPANGHLACYATNDPEGCGQIEADPLALIYNAVLLRLDIFVSPESQRAGLSEQAQFLPDPANKGSAIVSVHGVASELAAAPTRLDLSAAAIISYGRGNLSTDIHYDTQTENSSVNTFNLTHHFNHYEFNAGTYGYSAGGALNDIDLIGVGFATSFNTRVDLEQAFSSQLPVFLPRRAVVQILVNGRIHSGASYAAGNQLLDTTALPDGTYEVEIVINDASGEPRRERRLFTKSALIPPAGRWLLSATAGAIRNSTIETLLPEASTSNVAGVSAARRIGDRSAYRLGVLQYDETTIGQGEFLYLGPRWSLNVAMSAGEQNLQAASIQSTYRLKDHHVSLNATHFSSSVITAEDSPNADFFVADNSRLDLSYQRNLPWLSYGASIGIKRENTVTVADTVAGLNTGTVQGSAELSAQSGNADFDTRTFSLFAQRPILRSRHRRGLIGFRYQQDDKQSLAQLSLDLYFGRGNWRAGTSAALINSSDRGSQWQSSASTGWRLNKPGLGKVAANAYVTNASDLQTYGVSTELKHSWFRANASSDFSRFDNESTTRNSIASFSAHAGFDDDGGGLGGGDIAGAGLIVDVSGEPAGEPFDVLVNNVRVDEGRIGNPQFIGLQAFDQYNVKLRPHSVLSNGIGDTSHTLTLFPGNIGRLSVTARQQALLIAMVADETGNTIDNAVVTTSSNTLLIDDSGLLQAEVHQGEVLEVRKQDGSTCQITVDIAVMEDVVVPDAPIVCVSRTFSAIPISEDNNSLRESE